MNGSVLQDLYNRCEKMRPTLFRLASDTEDNDEALGERDDYWCRDLEKYVVQNSTLGMLWASMILCSVEVSVEIRIIIKALWLVFKLTKSVSMYWDICLVWSVPSYKWGKWVTIL